MRFINFFVALTFCILHIDGKAQMPNIVTLMCIDSQSGREMIVKFEESSNMVFGGNFETKITNDVIFYKTKGESGTIFQTTIYRSTGRYRVTVEGTNITFGGTCQLKQPNRF